MAASSGRSRTTWDRGRNSVVPSEAEGPSLNDQAAYRGEKVSPRGPSGLGRDDGLPFNRRAAPGAGAVLDRLEVAHQSRFSLSVRMKCSAQPLPSGARTKAGELSMPRKPISFWKWSDMYCDPCHGAPQTVGDASWRTRRSTAARPGGSAPGLGSGWPVYGRGCRRIRRSNDRPRRTPRPGLAGDVVVRSVPHIVSPFGDDGAVMVARPRGEPTRGRREQIVLAHQPEHPAQRGAGSGMTQSCPDLAMPSPWNGLAASTPRIAVVSASSDIAPSGPRRCAQRVGAAGQVAIHTRAGEPPDPADRGQAVRFAGDRRDSAAHGLRLRRAKGRRPPGWRSSRSAGRARSAPPRAWPSAGRLSSSSPVAGRVVSAASPAARKASRQPVSVAAVTPS